jgi:hypothetical protein
MAYFYSWPATLPQSPQKGFTESGGATIIRTPMDSGIAKQRTRGRKASILNLTFIMSKAQVETLEYFVKVTLSGTIRFGFSHPRTRTVVEVRMVPQQEGVVYNLSNIAPDYYSVSMQLEVLP